MAAFIRIIYLLYNIFVSTISVPIETFYGCPVVALSYSP